MAPIQDPKIMLLVFNELLQYKSNNAKSRIIYEWNVKFVYLRKRVTPVRSCVNTCGMHIRTYYSLVMYAFERTIDVDDIWVHGLLFITFLTGKYMCTSATACAYIECTHTVYTHRLLWTWQWDNISNDADRVRSHFCRSKSRHCFSDTTYTCVKNHVNITVIWFSFLFGYYILIMEGLMRSLAMGNSNPSYFMDSRLCCSKTEMVIEIVCQKKKNTETIEGCIVATLFENRRKCRKEFVRKGNGVATQLHNFN